MSGKDDKHQADIERQRTANRQRHGDDRGNVNDSPLLHPANEGHDEERTRDRLERWAAQESADGPDARRLREMAGGARVQGGPIGNERFVEQGVEPPPVKMHGSPYNRDENLREKHAAAGEPAKHPRRREDTTPEPGRGAHRLDTVTGEPPDVKVGPAGAEYEHGQVPPRKGSHEGT